MADEGEKAYLAHYDQVCIATRETRNLWCMEAGRWPWRRSRPRQHHFLRRNPRFSYQWSAYGLLL